MKKTLKLLMPFLIMSASCATTPNPIRFDAEWKFCDVGGETYACLSLEDTKKLRELLIRGGCQK